MTDKLEERGEERSAQPLVSRAAEAMVELLEETLPTGLYIVATPIGNLADISLRALSVLARADLIAAEDTRHSRKLLSRYGIKNDLTPYHEHNAAKERPKLIARVREGYAVALISDAGTPLISDPGYKLVREALDAGLAVTSIPGPSATLAALTSSGLPTDTFLFAGFLPAKGGPRRARIEELKNAPATLLFYETAPRLPKSVADLAEILGPREAALAKELTKLHESVARGTLPALALELAQAGELRGEYVVVVGPPGEDAALVSDEVIKARLKDSLKTESFRDAVRIVAGELKTKRSRVYELGLAFSRSKDAAR